VKQRVRLSVLVVLISGLAACSTPQYMLCAGKGTVTLQGIYGGGLTIDCPPPGMEFYSGNVPPNTVPSGTTPAVPGRLFVPAARPYGK